MHIILQGLIISIGGLVFEHLRQHDELPTVSNINDLENRNLHVIGNIPFIQHNHYRYKADITHLNMCLLRAKMLHPLLISFPKCNEELSDAYNALYSAIHHDMVLNQHRSLLFTSPGSFEGKSINAANTAIEAARHGSRTLIIDSNLTTPVLDFIFLGTHCRQGLTNVLGRQIEWPMAIRETAIENLYLLPAGPLVKNATELIAAPVLADIIGEITSAYDLVILDSPPVLGSPDTVNLSACIDRVIMITHSRTTTFRAIDEARERLQDVQEKIAGYIVTSVHLDDQYDYSNYYEDF